MITLFLCSYRTIAYDCDETIATRRVRFAFARFSRVYFVRVTHCSSPGSPSSAMSEVHSVRLSRRSCMMSVESL